MNEKEFSRLLKKLGACEEAVAWAKGKSLEEVWNQCDRGDWLLWLCGKMVGQDGWPTRQEVVLAACSCAETALRFLPKGELRPKNAIDVARKWARGEAAIEEVRSAASAAADAAAYVANAANAAANAANAASAAAYAANAASAAADAAYVAYAAANAAAYVAYAANAAANAANAASAAAYVAARKRVLQEAAEIVRKELGLKYTGESR